MSSMWREFFDGEAATYEDNPFTKNTVAEVDFLLSLYPLKPGAAVLDVGCGTGRHSIELAKRGFKMTGLDLSEGMLDVARKNAAAALPSPPDPLSPRGIEGELKVEWVHADAKDFALDTMFDGAICLCEGSLGLIEKGENAMEHDLTIYKNIAKHLKPNAPLVVTCLNGYSVIRQMKDEFIADGRFNPATMVSHYMDEWNLPSGTKQIQVYERLFIAPEVVNLLEQAGFVVDAVYGGTAGYWGRRPLSLDEVEAMFCSRKKP